MKVGTKIPKIGASMYGSNGRMYTTVPTMQADRATVLHISNFFSTVHAFTSLKLSI